MNLRADQDLKSYSQPRVGIYVGLVHFWGFKILNFNILGVFRKKNILGYEDYVDIFGGSSHI